MNKDFLIKAAEKFGTPIYLYDLPMILERIDSVKNVFEDLDFSLAFAMKANFNRDILRTFNNIGLMIDCVSLGEYLQARKVGFSPNKAIINGNCKKYKDLRQYIDDEVFSINLDSFEELLRLEKLTNKPTRVCIRVNPDIDPKTHPRISTGLKEKQFGVDYDTAAAMIEKIAHNSKIKLIGLHCHIGSQITNVEPYEEAIISIRQFVDRMKLKLEVLNIGGGWGIDYGDGSFLDLQKYKQKVVPLLKDFNCRIILELGRFVVAPAGYLVTKVEYVKKTKYKTFVVVDTGMTHLIRPAMYDAKHRIIFLYDSSNRDRITADIVGPACESSDVIRNAIEMPIPVEGELLAICDVGAYGYSMASDYNLIPKPIEVIWDGEEFFRSF